jgi:hypothetical protein
MFSKKESIHFARLCVFRKFPARPDEMTGVAVGVALQIVLMLRLSRPERTLGNYLGHHPAGPKPGGIDLVASAMRRCSSLV